MAEPSARTSRLAIAGALSAALLFAGGGFFAGRSTAPQPAPLAPPPIRATLPPAAPEPRRLLGRADFIHLARQAADAFASGAELPENILQASGRRFDLVIPFGCAGPADADSGQPMRWHYDAEAQTLRASVNPVHWQEADWGLKTPEEPAPGEQIGQKTEEKAEDSTPDTRPARGFWISRPWTSSTDCPAQRSVPPPADTEAAPVPQQTLAIAQFSSGGAERGVWHGGRPFEVVQRLAPEYFTAQQWLRLRVKGRIDGARQGGPVRCVQPGGWKQAPACVIAVQMEEIQIELPATGEALGTWSVDR